MPISPSKYTYGETCLKSVGENGYTENALRNMAYDFNLSPNYRRVYITSDSSTEQEFLHEPSMENKYGSKTYDSWVFDGTEEERTVGHKYIQMYPYKTPILSEGQYISFDYYNTGLKSTWLVVALSSDSEYEQIGKIRMCTNEIRFYDEFGSLIRIPCVFDDKINSQKNVSLHNMKYINGITTIFAQINEDSNKLHANQRLLFGRPGNWTAFKIVSVGINNFMNTTYYDNESAKVFEITMEANYVNYDTDDVVNGIADAPKFSVEINQGDIVSSVGEAIILSANILKDGEIVDGSVVWSSSSQSVATIDSLGNVMCMSVGNTTIKAQSSLNPLIYDEITISVEASPEINRQIIVSPYELNSYGILQGEEQTFYCYLYENGVKKQDEFIFDIVYSPNVENFLFSVIDGNSFYVKNIKMSTENIVVACNTGIHSFSANINLKGAW